MPRTAVPVLDRLRANSEQIGECLVWQGSVVGEYGQIRVGDKIMRVHRAAWIERYGEIPAETPIVRHVGCNNKLCWADEHLMLGTQKDNMADRDASGHNHWANQTHCPNNHEYTPETTEWIKRDGRPGRRCLTCKRAHERRKTQSKQRVLAT